MSNRSWTRVHLNKIPEQNFWIGLSIATLYLSYRYPLQINSSGTSPSYADTPTSLQAGKFVLTFFVCCISAPFIFAKQLSRFQVAIVVLTIAIFSFPLFKLLGSFDSPYVDISFWPLAALVLVIPLRSIRLDAIDRYFKVVFWLALMSDLIQVALFVLFGRLPALAYKESVSVRFGGFLDDPNGFGAILFLLMGWSFYRFNGKKRIFMQLALVILLLLTQSLTSIGFLGILIFVMTCRQFVRKPLSIFWILIVSAAILALLEITHAFEIISLALAHKSGSAADHLSIPWGDLIGGWAKWFFFGGTSYQPYESFWVSSLINFGAVWYVGNLILTFVLVYRVWRVFQSFQPGKEKSVLAGIFLYCTFFVIGSANLPFFGIFPINFLFYLFCFLISFRETTTRDMLQNTSQSAHFGDMPPAPIRP